MISKDLMSEIAEYMDDTLREELHAKLAPCDPEVFLAAYLEVCPEFNELLLAEFNLNFNEAHKGGKYEY